MSATNLTKAFRALRRAGYFARQNFMCCQSCAWSAIPAGVKCVFYDIQAAKNARNDGVVPLMWEGNGKEIVSILKGHDLAVAWGGSDEGQILVLVNPQFPLHVACIGGDYELTKRILKVVADPNKIDKFGAVPLHYCQSALIAKLLLDAGANVELDNDWISPLHSAIQINAIEVVRLLVEAGADIERKTRGTGDSPLECSEGGWRSEINTYLISVLEARQLQATVPHAKEEARVMRL